MAVVSFQDVAEVALYHCVQREYTINDKGSSEVTKIEYSYEFLDDYFTPVPTMSMFVNQMSPWKNKKETDFEGSIAQNSNCDVPLKPIPTVQGPPYVAVSSEDLRHLENVMGNNDGQESWLQEKYDSQNHPLELMVRIMILFFY